MENNDKAVLLGAAIPTVVCSVVVAIVALVAGGTDALVGSVLGSIVVLLFCGVGLAVIMRVRGRNPYALMYTALLTYLVKILALAGLLVLLNGTTAFDTKAFGWSILVGVAVWTIAEIRAFSKLQVFYVEPLSQQSPRSGQD